MKREEREFVLSEKEHNPSYKENQPTKKHQSQTAQNISNPHNEWEIPKKSVPIDHQLSEYKTRMNILRKCGNTTDPLQSNIRLNPSHPLFALRDVLENKWCFDLITLWKHLEGYNTYDIEKLYKHFGGSYVISEFKIPGTLFKVNLVTFDTLKREFYKYAYGIDIPSFPSL
jgi:hypothetical protein